MNMFRQSEINDDELIQADRLDEALSDMFSGGATRIDQREDPELSELTSLGKLLRLTADEATSRGSFHSFHMRSRSALLHRIAEARQTPAATGFFGSVLEFMRARSTVMSGVGSSIVTALVLLLISNFGATSSDTTAVANVTMANSSVGALEVSAKSRGSSGDQIISNQSTTSSSNLNSSAIDSSDITITGLIMETIEVHRGKNSVSPFESSVEVMQTSPYALSINSLQAAIETLESADIEGVVSVDMVRQVTDELARVGFEMRSGHPGAKNAGDIEDFQNAIVRAIVILQRIEQFDKDVQASLIAAKIVAEEGMYITTMYVNANQASR